MPFTTTVTTTASNNLDYTYSYSNSISASAKLSVNESIPSGTTNNFSNFTFNTGSGVFLAMASDVSTYNLKIKTNSSTTPINYFNISSTGNLVYFNLGSATDSSGVLIKNISGIYIDNTGTSVASLRIDSLFDTTPSI